MLRRGFHCDPPIYPETVGIKETYEYQTMIQKMHDIKTTRYHVVEIETSFVDYGDHQRIQVTQVA